MITSSFNSLPDVDSELFEQVTDDELALLDCYRTLQPDERAAVLEALVRMVEPVRQAQKQWRRGHAAGISPASRDVGGKTGFC
jgi:ubiquinone/menaquinone biosynthesis C-methylase UbiE